MTVYFVLPGNMKEWDLLRIESSHIPVSVCGLSMGQNIASLYTQSIFHRNVCTNLRGTHVQAM